MIHTRTIVKAKSLGLNSQRLQNCKTIDRLAKTYYCGDLLLVRGALTHCATLKMLAQNYLALSVAESSGKICFLRSEMVLSMDELNLYQAPQDINKEEFQRERVCLQAFVTATEPG
ncbi:hypothetical protein TNCV_3724101 [Trichonephila clavipes]|nr:hypothetical protein TNCV_3724101 [Trichonephila clavipes]